MVHSKALDIDANVALYKRLVAGDVKARDEMIEGNTGLVVFRVDSYLRTSPQMAYYRDDMISAGLVGLCKAVEYMKARGPIKSPKPAGYITKIVDWHIAKVVDERDTIVVSHTTQKRGRANGTPSDPPKVVSEKALLGRAAPIPFTPSSVIELQEELLASCRDDLDRKIVAMRTDGYTHEEIAGTCLMSKSGITYRIRRIGERLVERCPEYRQYVIREDKDD